MIANSALDALRAPFSADIPSTTKVEIAERDPALPTPFRVGVVAAAALGACGAAVAEIWRQRSGQDQSVRVDLRAAEASLVSFFFLRLNGVAPPIHSLDIPTTGLYGAKDGRWIHLHGGFPHFHQGVLDLLHCQATADDIATAVREWDAFALEEALATAGQCGAVVRSAEEWAIHPQGQACKQLDHVEIVKIGDSPPEPWAVGNRPLSGVRVLDFTRVLAGPACARLLAEHGADVLKITSPTLASIEPFVMDTGHGKRAAHLDLRQREAAERLKDLIRQSDIFSQGYRQGALARLGLAPEDLATLRPGIIVISINCYGPEGPWADRPGWEQLAQSATGLAAGQGTASAPQLIPAAACDYTTGYLAALGALVALIRRAKEGGSYSVRVSLCQTAMWIHGMGRAKIIDTPPSVNMRPGVIEQRGGFSDAEIARLSIETNTPWGRMRHLKPVTEFSQTPARWTHPCVPLGTHEAEWR